MEETKDHSNRLSNQEKGRDDENFPIGLKVLAIDANIVCLKYLVLLLHKCQYKVTATREAAEAIRLLKDEKEAFDIVITDVVGLDMDGFKLLHTIIGHGMDIPVVMVSANDELEMVKRGVMEGAEAYLLKPVRLPELRNIWQHVLRKRITCKKSNFNIMAQVQDQKRLTNYCNKEENEGDETANNVDENSNNNNNVGSSSCSKKKPRVTWSKERHAKFVQAYEQLGEKERVPNNILKLMNDPELSRENVASHLQKHRDGLRKKKAAGVGKFVSQKINYCSSMNYQRKKASIFGSQNLRDQIIQIPTSGQFQYPPPGRAVEEVPASDNYAPSGSGSCYFPAPEFKWFNFPSDNNSSMILKPCDQFLGFGSNNINTYCPQYPLGVGVGVGGDCLNYSTNSQTFGNCPIDNNNVGAIPQQAVPINTWQFPNNTTAGQCSQVQFDKGSSYGGLMDDDLSDIFRQETFLT